MWIDGAELRVEGSQALAALPQAGGEDRPASRLDWFRERAMTTPGKLVLVAAAVIIGAVAFGAIAWVGGRSYSRAARAATTETEPLLVQSASLYTSLSDANATVTATFLRGGNERPAQRAQYENDLRNATDALSKLTRELGSAPATRGAVTGLAEQIPVYAGLVEQARANNLQGFPVGAAYLRQASARLTNPMLPEADRIYATEAARLAGNYASGTSSGPLIAIGAAAVLAILLLLGAQLHLARVSRRVFNVWMLSGTAVLTAVAAWALIGLINQRSALTTARRASDAVEVLSASEVLVSRAQSDESLTLANRGGDETDPVDFQHVMTAVAPGDGLLGSLVSLRGDRGLTHAPNVDLWFSAYRTTASDVLALQDQGQTKAAPR